MVVAAEVANDKEWLQVQHAYKVSNSKYNNKNSLFFISLIMFSGKLIHSCISFVLSFHFILFVLSFCFYFVSFAFFVHFVLFVRTKPMPVVGATSSPGGGAATSPGAPIGLGGGI